MRWRAGQVLNAPPKSSKHTRARFLVFIHRHLNFFLFFAVKVIFTTILQFPLLRLLDTARQGGRGPACSALGKAGVLVLGLLFRRFQDLKRAHERLVHGHHASGVVELAAVVWRGEEGDQLAFGEEFVAVLDNLQQNKTFFYIDGNSLIHGL